MIFHVAFQRDGFPVEKNQNNTQTNKIPKRKQKIVNM